VPSLIRSLERWDSLALVFVERMARHSAVANFDLSVRLLLPGKGVLHPLLVITFGVVLAGVCTTGFLAICGRFRGLNTIDKRQFM
jgi:hypothetical protein